MPRARFLPLPAACLLLVTPAAAGPDEAPSPRALYAQTLRACVWVEVPEGEGKVSRGTGWIADRGRRLVVTNHHVVGGHGAATLQFPAYRDGKLMAERSPYEGGGVPAVTARVLGTDPARDLAVLQLDSLPEGAAELPLAEDDPAPSDRVHSIGNPAASDALWVYTSGTVRQVYRKRLPPEGGRRPEVRVVETQSPVNPGDSGGPVVNDAGRVVAVTATYRTDARLVTFCVAASEVRAYLAELRRAEPGEPRTAEGFMARGLGALGRKQYGPAADAFTAALRLDPDCVLAHLLRAKALTAAGEYDRAIADCDAALKLRPHSAVAYNNRAVALIAQKQYDRAVADLTRAIELDPTFALAHYNRGWAYETSQEGTRADADYARAVELDPKLAGDVGRHHARKVRVVNATGEPVTVHLQCEVRKDGTWQWQPAAPGGAGSLLYDFKPGESATLAVGDTAVTARRIRAWAVGTKTGRRWLAAQDDQDFPVAPPGGYLAREVGTFTWTIR